MKRTAIIATLFLIIASSAQPVPATALSNYTVQIFAGAKFYYTELYFGMDIPGGGAVSEKEWSKFLNNEVTPKFPDGFTVIEGYGQYNDKSGKVVKEKSRMLILLYPKKSRKDVDAKLEAIREAYKKAFRQESVLRMVFRKPCACRFRLERA